MTRRRLGTVLLSVGLAGVAGAAGWAQAPAGAPPTAPPALPAPLGPPGRAARAGARGPGQAARGAARAAPAAHGAGDEPSPLLPSMIGTVTKTSFAEALFSAQVEAGQTLTANAALAPLPPTPETVTLTGRVTDASTGAPLPGATLTATSGTVTLTATSGMDGRYSLSHIPPGTLGIGATASGFFTQSFQTAAPSGGTVTLDVALAPAPFTVTITAPADGATPPEDRVLVRGSVSPTFGPEIGVVVNGILALVDGPAWVAEVPLTPGPNVLTATATAPGAGAITQRLTVQVPAPQAPRLLLRASPVSGLAPLTVRFTVESGLPQPPIQYAFDANGDGTVDRTSTTFETISVTYPGRGLLTPTLTVTDAQGQTVTAQTVVQVLDRADLDSLLQAKWTALKDALRRGDIAGALPSIALRSRLRYEEAFRILAPRLPNIETILTDVTLVQGRNGVALYEATRTDAGLPKVFEVRFAVDEDGIWRVEAF